MIRLATALLSIVLLSNCSLAPRSAENAVAKDWKSTATWHGRDSVKLTNFDRLVPASTLHERDFPSWVRRDGAGTPGVLWRAPSKDQPFVSPIGTALPVTYIKGNDGLQIYDVLDRDTARVDGRETKLAINYTAPLAYMRKQGNLRLPVVRAMIKTDRYDDATGVYRFEPVDPNRIPVVFVHGLKSSPSIWKSMVNRIRADDVVRENYQFWSFSYPTGVPILYSGMQLRKELRRLQEKYNPGGIHPKMNKMIVIGHSMGGLLTELQIKDSGDAFWPKSRPELDSIDLPAEQISLLKESVYFRPVSQVKRAIFIASPHRGSDIAVSKFGEIISNIIRLPKDLSSALVSLAKLDPFFAEDEGIDTHIPNSVYNLRPDSDFIKALRGLPFEKGVPVHSIIATGEKPLLGPFTDANDGLVSYTSAHLDEAASEKLVQSGHRAPNHPQAISEVVRILRLHLEK